MKKFICCLRAPASSSSQEEEGEEEEEEEERIENSARRNSSAYSSHKPGSTTSRLPEDIAHTQARSRPNSQNLSRATPRKLSTASSAGSSGPAIAPATPWPVTIQMNSNLRSIIVYHEIRSKRTGENFGCWTYISQGLTSVGQKEVVFTLRRRYPEAECDFHRDPLTWFELMYKLAAEGRTVGAFERTKFISTHVLGRSDFQYILYGPPTDVPGLASELLPRERLHAIAITQDEAMTIKYCGMMRVLTHLGLSEHFFPYPPWIDRDRSSCITLEDMEGSVRRHVLQVMPVWGLIAVKKGSEVVLHIPKESEDDLKMAVQQETLINAFALDSLLSEEADSCLYWKRWQAKSESYGMECAEKKCTNMCFVAFFPGTKDSLQLIEDGYGVFLTDDTWQRLRAAVTDHQSAIFDLNAGDTIRLEWARDIQNSTR